MTEISERYARRAAAFADLVASVDDERWASPSPCEEWTARDVVRHIVDTQGMFLGLVGRELGDVPSVDEDPLAAVKAATGRVLADLEDPALAAETFDGMMGTMAFEASVDRFLSADLVVHRWDLAKATGQDATIPPQDLAEMQEAVKQFPAEAMRGPKAFGPEVEVPDDAGDQDKLLAFLGRTP